MIYLQLFFRYVRYYFKARTQYNTRSGFAAEFAAVALEDSRNFYAFPIIKSLRAYLKQDDTLLKMVDYGAGSKVHRSSEQRTVRQLVQSAPVGAYSGKILFRIAQHYKPQTLLELGTSLGISTLYQAYAALNSTLITIEGNPEVAQVAAANFRRFELTNIHQHIGNFDEQLTPILNTIEQLDLFFIDGNHALKPTLRYFEQGLEKASANSLFIFGDIHWSDEMEEAWRQIKQHRRVSHSIDLFYLGIVFFKEDTRKKEHFTLIPSRFKPWKRLGRMKTT